MELYPDQDTFEFDQGPVTKNQPIMVLVLLSARYITTCDVTPCMAAACRAGIPTIIIVDRFNLL